jgi:hypothetical protein
MFKDHFHPFLSRTINNNFDLFPAPEPEDFLAASNSFLEVIMYATDKHGLTTEVSRDVQPQKVLVDVVSVPPGLIINVNQYSLTTPQTITSWSNYNLPIEVEDQPPFKFHHWLDDESYVARKRTKKISFPDHELPKVVAVFCIDSVFDHNCNESEAECCSGRCIDRQCMDTPLESTNAAVSEAQATSLSFSESESSAGTATLPPAITGIAMTLTIPVVITIPRLFVLMLF